LTRRRIPLGISMALFGLAVFNLHYWGFGIPFVMAAAWLLVRSYREKRALTESVPGQLGPRRSVASSPASARPPASRRYTPPSGARRRRLA
ncbi:MAG TPA: hypothetical protein VKV34_02840, partial [Thermoleophilia bacterium]|nr:hypothetical protein [Thermoleophilia bacterium]